MDDEQYEPAAGLQHAGDFADRGLELVDVLECKARKNCVECMTAARQRLGACAGVVRSTAALVGDPYLRRRRVDADHLGAAPRDAPCDLTLSASDIEHAPRAVEMPGHQRQDLLFVFGIGTVGKTVLPPLRVLFPCLRVDARRIDAGRIDNRGIGSHAAA